MGNQDITFNRSAGKTVSRRSLLKVGAAASAVAAGVVAPSLGGVASARGRDRPETIRVEDIHITLNVIDPLPNPTFPSSVTYFLTIGNITDFNGQVATGTFYCRGCLTNPTAIGLPALFPGTPTPVGGFSFVDQRFLVDGLGQIHGSGDEGDAGLGGAALPLLVVGGSGAFRKARGTYVPDAGLPIPFGAGTINFTFDHNS